MIVVRRQRRFMKYRQLASWRIGPSFFRSGGLISIANGMKYVAWISDPMNRDAEDMRFRLFAPFEEREIILDQSQPGMLMAAEFSPIRNGWWPVAGTPSACLECCFRKKLVLSKGIWMKFSVSHSLQIHKLWHRAARMVEFTCGI